MNNHGGAPFARIFASIYLKKVLYFGAFFAILAVSILTLGALDLLPEPKNTATEEPSITLSTSPLVAAAAAPEPAPSAVQKEFPQKIEIPAVGISAIVSNPAKTDIATLDAALLSGTVRYPTSARLGEDGNVVIFGHSSYLPVVHNPAFKAFTGIEKLKRGDTITVYGKEQAYVYAVESVTEADAESAAIPLQVSGKKLTLSTCDSFGKKTDRFIVVADLVETRAL